MIINIKEIFLVFLIHPLTLCSDYIICLWQSSLFFKKKKKKKKLFYPVIKTLQMKKVVNIYLKCIKSKSSKTPYLVKISLFYEKQNLKPQNSLVTVILRICRQDGNESHACLQLIPIASCEQKWPLTVWLPSSCNG